MGGQDVGGREEGVLAAGKGGQAAGCLGLLFSTRVWDRAQDFIAS